MGKLRKQKPNKERIIEVAKKITGFKVLTGGLKY
jgi:hypothetical protein